MFLRIYASLAFKCIVSSSQDRKSKPRTSPERKVKFLSQFNNSNVVFDYEKRSLYLINHS